MPKQVILTEMDTLEVQEQEDKECGNGRWTAVGFVPVKLGPSSAEEMADIMARGLGAHTMDGRVRPAKVMVGDDGYVYQRVGKVYQKPEEWTNQLISTIASTPKKQKRATQKPRMLVAKWGRRKRRPQAF